MIITLPSSLVIGVTQRIDRVEGRAELRDALDQRLVQWVADAGFLPVPIPNAIHGVSDSSKLTLDCWLDAVRPSALILSGGNDIGEYPERDATEGYLLSWAEKNRVPVLGICRGLQMMAVRVGIDLVKVEGHVGTRHQLMVSSKADKLPTNVNSYHNWAISSCPDGFQVVARAEDGLVEAMRHHSLPWEGWMWHPEREVPFSSYDTDRLKRLFSEK